MSSFIRPRKPVSEEEKNETSRLFGDLVSKLDDAEAADAKKDKSPSRFFGFKGFMPR